MPHQALKRRRKLEEKLRKINANDANGINNRNRGKFGMQDGEWSSEENALLVKGMKKYPSGTPARWERISRFIGRGARPSFEEGQGSENENGEEKINMKHSVKKVLAF